MMVRTLKAFKITHFRELRAHQRSRHTSRVAPCPHRHIVRAHEEDQLEFVSSALSACNRSSGFFHRCAHALVRLRK